MHIVFLSELRQISTNFDIFGRKMVKRIKLCEMHPFPPHLICVATLPC